MSHFEYKISQEVACQDLPFYALIMAAMRQADSTNLEKLKSAWPETWAEFHARYNGPNGLLSQELKDRGIEKVRGRYPCFRGRESQECLGCANRESCATAKEFSTTGDLHITCPKKGTWRADPACVLVDICDGCGEERA